MVKKEEVNQKEGHQCIAKIRKIEKISPSVSTIFHIKTRCCNGECPKAFKVEFGEVPNGKIQTCFGCFRPIQYMVGGADFNKNVQYKKEAKRIGKTKWLGPLLMAKFMDSIITK